jgi:hypothetical protein
MPKLRGPGFFTFFFGSILLLGLGLVGWAVVKSPRHVMEQFKRLYPDEPLEEEAYAQLISKGQKLLTEGKAAEAVAAFEQAFLDGEKKAARSLRAHAQAAVDQPAGATCALRGLGHPRPFDLATKSSRPSLAVFPRELLSAWVAPHGEKQRPVFVTRLDYALRRVAPIQVVTPEAIEAHDPQLFAREDSVALLYSDARGESPGIYARLLDTEGNVKAGPRMISAAEGAFTYDPTLAREQDGSYWVVYTQVTDAKAKVHDLFVRRVDRELAPLAEPIRLTAYAQPKKNRTVAAQAAVEATGGVLNIAYRLRRGSDAQVVLLRAREQALELKQGESLQGAANRAVSAPGEEEGDRFAGEAIVLSEGNGAYNYPRMACVDGGCLVVWDDEKAGGFAAAVAKDSGEVLWRRNFAPEGARPSLGRSGSRAVVVWYEDSRVQLASIDKDGLGKPTVIGRVGGRQPHPEVVAGAEPGQWYISWRDYEAAVFEPFVARVDCK